MKAMNQHMEEMLKMMEQERVKAMEHQLETTMRKVEERMMEQERRAALPQRFDLASTVLGEPGDTGHGAMSVELDDSQYEDAEDGQELDHEMKEKYEKLQKKIQEQENALA